MINKSLLRIGVTIAACCLTLACNRGSTPPSNGAATKVVNKIEDIASVERNGDGHVVRLSLYGAAYESAQLDWPGEFSPVEEVVFQECPWMVDRQLEHLSGLPRLRSLKLIRVPISDSGLTALSHIEPLRELQLSYTNVTGNGLSSVKHLELEKLVINSKVAVGEELAIIGEMKSLTSLTIQAPTVSIADLKFVASLEQLEHLDIMHCQELTEEAITGLGEMRNLKTFIFPSSGVTDAMLARIGTFKRLIELDLSDSAVSDLGLEHLVGLPDLERLILYKSQVKGTGLSLLADAKQLKYIMLYSAQLNEAGRAAVVELRSSLPDCEIELSAF